MIRTRITQFILATAVISLMTGLCGCDIVADILTMPDEGKDDGSDIDSPFSIDIGLVVPLTGEYAAPYGMSMERGFNLARDEINGLPNNLLAINFLVENDMSTQTGMVSAFERLIQAGVPAIVGIVISEHAQHAFPIAQENQVVAFSSASSAAGLSSIGDYVFRAALAVDKMNPAGVNITHDALGYESAALIYDDADLYSTSSYEQLTAALLDRGVEVLLTDTFQTGETDFTAQLTAIMESNPDALFISGLAPEVVSAMVQAREIGIEAQYIVPELGIIDIQQAGDAADGVITFTSWDSALDNPMNRAFVASYQAAYGFAPDPWAAQSYATLYILYSAIAEAAFADESPTVAIPDAMAIRDALAEIRDFPTNLGSFSFDADGEAVYEPVVLMVKNGSLVPFGDPEIEPETEVNATINPTSGNEVTGTAVFTPSGDSITLTVEIQNASPGLHGVHIHEYGDCSAPDGTSAGGHWNPTNAAHGKWGEGEFHLGDIGNIVVGENGTGTIELTTDLWEIGTGSIIDVVGKSIIVHAGADDFTSQPSGAAGARIGCGAIAATESW